MNKPKHDIHTAQAFSHSWNNLPLGPIYNKEQFEQWLAPITKENIENKSVLELGCGNGSMMFHVISWNPKTLVGVDLGDSIYSAVKNMENTGFKNWKIKKADLISYESPGFDFVYCVGVLHHTSNPFEGFKSVLRNTKKGGSFHCWVYGKEGNLLVMLFVEPLRRVFSRFPWWFTKYFVALPLAVPFYTIAKVLASLKGISLLKRLPLFDYFLWISDREFAFFRHVAFDQLVSPHTVYIDKKTIEKWLDNESIEKESLYIIFRNCNSWKFGGKLKL